MSFVVARMSAAAGLPTTVLGMNTILLLLGVALLVWAGYAFNQLIRLRNQTRAA